ncbi:protrudin-like isoform X2 [Acanthaster planci]|uniref:Protrudin n=1 Tax=Acanthaster planci TaxID=133434 RepID=A0A8B7XJ55_ACAPL|nr:protrudin-like isoform X2 [Acanthaster planci]
MTMANCQSSVKNPDTMATGNQSTTLTATPGPRLSQYSVSNLVESVHRLERLCWYVMVLWRIIVFLFRWESPFVTLSFWITSLLICYFMESGQIMASSLVLLFLLAGSGGVVNFKLQEHGPSRSKTQPSSNSPASFTNPQQGVEQSPACIEQQQKKGREVLAEYRQLMLQAQDWLNSACNMLERLHGILGWQDATWSSVFYGGSSVIIILVCLLPLRWFVMATISSILCINRDFVVLLKQVYESAHCDHLSDGNDKKKEEKIIRHDGKKLHPRHFSDAPCRQPASMNGQSKQKSKSLDEAGPNYSKVAAANRNRSSTAPELPTLKLNSAGMPVEVCFLCGTMFTSVLKRRRYCRSCGYQFCQRCCFRKLPRCVFGATSPAAQTEKELVCNTCYATMKAEDSTQVSGGTTMEER